jgi:XRE family transcriptional regulator, fatty acid utilization regulator
MVTSAARKLFIGPRLRRLREQKGINQATLAERLGLSLSYVSQIENNQRPVTAGVLLRLAEAFDGDVAQFSDDPDKRMLGELDSALSDRSLVAASIAPPEVARLVEQAPELVGVFLTLYQRHLRLQEEHGQMIDRFYGEQQRAMVAPLPHDEVRDYFNRRSNYVDTLDRLAETLAHEWQVEPGERAAAMRRALKERLRIEVVTSPELDASGTLRRYMPESSQLLLASQLSDSQKAFQMATQYALIAHREEIHAEVQEAGFTDAQTQAITRQGLAHYFAGALLLPYRKFLSAAKACRYDAEWLEQSMGVSFETVCHRLSTMQRRGARGVPFYFVRVDQAGNISKRQSATTFHFAHHGGACPLWQVHRAFAHPGRLLAQVAEMPDGARYFSIARTVERGGGGYLAHRKLFSIGLGCELAQARELVYADGLDFVEPRHVAKIGPGCRVCTRPDCVQRAFPPAGKPLLANTDGESLVSYRFSE